MEAVSREAPDAVREHPDAPVRFRCGRIFLCGGTGPAGSADVSPSSGASAAM